MLADPWFLKLLARLFSLNFVIFCRHSNGTLPSRWTCQRPFSNSRRMAISRSSATSGSRQRSAQCNSIKKTKTGSPSLASGAFSLSPALPASSLSRFSFPESAVSIGISLPRTSKKAMWRPSSPPTPWPAGNHHGQLVART